jgi:hypothetical protein
MTIEVLWDPDALSASEKQAWIALVELTIRAFGPGSASVRFERSGDEWMLFNLTYFEPRDDGFSALNRSESDPMGEKIVAALVLAGKKVHLRWRGHGQLWVALFLAVLVPLS